MYPLEDANNSGENSSTPATNGHGNENRTVFTNGVEDTAPDPSLYFLDVGLGANTPTLSDVPTNGKILRLSPSSPVPVPIVTGLAAPDGIAVVPSLDRIFWTNMGADVSTKSGTLMSCSLSSLTNTGPNTNPNDIEVQALIAPNTLVTTPKQTLLRPGARKALLLRSRRHVGAPHRRRRDESRGPHSTTPSLKHTPILAPGGVPTQDQSQWCVGIAIDFPARKIYWTQKGAAPKSNTGRIFRAGLDIPARETASNRTDIELLFENLPEPIDLELARGREVLYWTDRGEHPRGSSLNRGFLLPTGKGEGERKVEIVARHFTEPIGLVVDVGRGRACVTDLGGCLWRMDLGNGRKEAAFEGEGCYTGVAAVW